MKKIELCFPILVFSLLIVCKMPFVCANEQKQRDVSSVQELQQSSAYNDTSSADSIPRGFIAEHRNRYFTIARKIDSMLTKYSRYYAINRKKRSIRMKRELTAHDKAMIIKASKQLDAVIELYALCSPADYDYCDIKEKYLPVLREMNHRFHTYVMQPLNVSTLDTYDHMRKILVPVVQVAIGVCLILLLKKMRLLPDYLCADTRTLLLGGAIVAACGIAYRYRKQISEHGNQMELFVHPGVDFGALVQKEEASENDVDGTLSPVDMADVAEQVVDAIKQIN